MKGNTRYRTTAISIMLFSALIAISDMAMCQQVDSLIWNGTVFSLDKEESDMKFVPTPRAERQMTDTLHWKGASIVIDISNFIQPPICLNGHDGSFSR